MYPDQAATAATLPQPLRVIDNVPAAYVASGNVLVIDADGIAHLISPAGDTYDGTYAYYLYATDEAKRGAAANAKGVSDYGLGDVCYGVAIERPGFLAILATDPDRPADGWGYWIGTPETFAPGDVDWNDDIPAAWGTTPRAIGAAFARACRPR